MILEALQCIWMGQSLVCQVTKWGRGSKSLPELWECVLATVDVLMCVSLLSRRLRKKKMGKLLKNINMKLR